MLNEKQDHGSEEPDTQTYLKRLLVSDPLRKPVLRSAIQALKFPIGSRGLDAGCGIGLQAVLLAEVVGPTGHVTGLDMCPEFLAYAQGIVEKSGLSGRISFQKGNINNLPFDDDTFDWIWSTDCAGYHPTENPPALVKELARVVRPGGSVSILAHSSQMLLPGYPLLEARLNATSAGVAPFTEGKKPTLHYLRALGWLRDAGLAEPTAQTFVGSYHAPLRDEIRDALTSLCQMRWETARSEVTQEDWAEFQRLCQPASSDFILNLPDYYAFFTYSLFHGKIAE